MRDWGKKFAALFLFLSIFGVGFSLPALAQFGSSQDLTVSDIQTNPVEPEPGARVDLLVTVTNSGQANILQGFNVRFKVDGQLITDRRVNFGLGAGQNQQLSTAWRATEGDHVFSIQIDPFNDVFETNEFNNTSELPFTVRRPGAIRSVTFDLIESIGIGLQEDGSEIQVEYNPDIFTLVNIVQKAFAADAQASSAAATKISNLIDSLPGVLQDEAQITTAKEIRDIFLSMAEHFDQASQGLLTLNVSLVPAAFEGIRVEIERFSALSISGVSYEGLSESIPMLEEALSQAEQLQAALSGQSVDINAVALRLTELMNDIGQVWNDVGLASIESAALNVPVHTDSNGAVIESFSRGDEVTISVAEAASLNLEIYSSAGELIYSQEAEGNSLTWDGNSNDGRLLAPDRYYCRLEVTDAQGNTRIEIVQLIIADV